MNHPLQLAYRFKFNKKKEGRPSLTWRKSLNQDFDRYEELDIEEWEELAKDKEKLKKKVEEIYKNEDSEISDGVSTEEEDQGKGSYKHWKKKG